MLHDPTTAKGFFSWALLGFGIGLVALTVAYLFPSIIPASAASTRL